MPPGGRLQREKDNNKEKVNSSSGINLNTYIQQGASREDVAVIK